MSSPGILRMVQINIDVPRGEAGYWSIILDLDQSGPWTVRQICDRTNVQTQAVGNFVRKLRLAGIANVIDRKPASHGGGDNLPATVVYRLAKRPLLSPRLARDGKVMPETAIEQLWRAIKMAKVFSLAELAEHCPDVPPKTAKAYLYQLSKAGIVAGKPAAYRLARKLGPLAPKVLATRVVFDPNSKSVIGLPVASEVTP
jgi:hypothetical protein